MKKHINFIVIPLLILLMAMKSDKAAYQYFTPKGKKISYGKMMKQIEGADVVFFGELHNNAMSHWMELEIAKDLVAAKGENLVMGAEMFEADGQLLIDEYLSGKVKKKYYDDQARLWPNYKTDYAPLLKLAKDNKLKFIATNVPRRYAAIVNGGGFEALNDLSDEAKKYMAPLPIKYDATVGCYKKMEAMMAHMPGAKHGASNIAKSQALKDATMAHFILKNWTKGQTFYHFNGSYHSDNHEGIVWWLKQQNPKLKILTITTIEQENLDSVADTADLSRADFIFTVDEDITKTY